MYLVETKQHIIYKLKKHNFYLVEDSCHVLGSSYYFNKKKKLVAVIIQISTFSSIQN